MGGSARGEYRRKKKSLEWELESLLAPEVDAAKEAGRLLADMPRLWLGATLRERHQLLTTILDAVYIDLKDKKSIVSVKAKPAFQAVLEVTDLVVAARDDNTRFSELIPSKTISYRCSASKSKN